MDRGPLRRPARKGVPVLTLLLALLAAGAIQSLQAQPVISSTDFRVKLLGPLNARTSQKGDQVAAQVRSPEEFRDAIMEASRS